MDIVIELPELMELLEMMNKQILEAFRCVTKTKAIHIKLWENLSIETMGPDLFQKHLAPLYDKIIQGGSGVWGERPMTPHPALSAAEAAEIVNYILSLSAKTGKLPLKDAIVLKEHIGKGTEGSYLLNASYTDQGANGIEPLQSGTILPYEIPLFRQKILMKGMCA